METVATGKFDPTRFLSKRYTGREPSIIRNIVSESTSVPGMLSLGGGLPNPQLFPLKGLQATLSDGTVMDVPSEDLQAALQYGPSAGMRKFMGQLKHIHKRFHNCPMAKELLVGTGSQSLLARSLDMVLNPGDSLLLEAPSYPGTLSAAQAIGPRYVPIKTDSDGLVPEDLRARLDSWDSALQGPKPRVLYCIPTGQNPSGATLPHARRVEIYKLAQEHDFVIIEDDPYYFLYLGKQGGTRDPPPSFESMDVDGRVIRLDSLSKVLSSGLRLGFMSGHPKFVEAVLMDMQGTDLHASQLSQVFVSTLLDQWGDDGWDKHIATVKDFYAERRERFLEACENHLTGLADWAYPEAGMFVWFHFKHVSDTFDLILKEAKAEKVLLIPGQCFFTDDKPSNCARASFSVASDEDMDEALRRLANLIRKHQTP